MKPRLAPHIPGNTEWERFDNAVRMALTVPKEALSKEEVRLKKLREKKRLKNERGRLNHTDA